MRDVVRDSPEFRRILDLPRRVLDVDDAFIDRLTHALRTPYGAMRLRPIQALALKEICNLRGLFGPMRVGSGKTLVSYLAPTMVQSIVPLWVVPASLRKKTLLDFAEAEKNFKGPKESLYSRRIISYELLGRPQAGSLDGGTLLDKYAPDMIIFDEAHKLRDQRTAVCKRVTRYLKKNPETMVVAMSGTMTKRSVLDYAHILRWCLRELAPIPLTFMDLQLWASALDEKILPGMRAEPGPLLSFAKSDSISDIRQGFRDRLIQSPGVVATQDGPLDMSLTIRALEPAVLDSAIDLDFEKLRTTWETPDDHPIADALTFRRHAFELALGFFYVWDPRPPEGWLEARRAWAAQCRMILQTNKRGLDSEAQAVQAVVQGLYPQAQKALEEWRVMDKQFTPNPIPVWRSTEALDAAQNSKAQIIWTDHRAFGIRLSKITGWPYYGQQGVDSKGHAIELHKGGPLIASLKSNGTGRNLQKFNHSLVMSPPASGLTWEQLLGRTHRDGQQADEVIYDVYLACEEHLKAMDQARADAKYMEDTQGQAQKILYGSYDYSTQRKGIRFT